MPQALRCSPLERSVRPAVDDLGAILHGMAPPVRRKIGPAEKGASDIEDGLNGPLGDAILLGRAFGGDLMHGPMLEAPVADDPVEELPAPVRAESLQRKLQAGLGLRGPSEKCSSGLALLLQDKGEQLAGVVIHDDEGVACMAKRLLPDGSAKVEVDEGEGLSGMGCGSGEGAALLFPVEAGDTGGCWGRTRLWQCWQPRHVGPQRELVEAGEVQVSKAVVPQKKAALVGSGR